MKIGCSITITKHINTQSMFLAGALNIYCPRIRVIAHLRFMASLYVLLLSYIVYCYPILLTASRYVLSLLYCVLLSNFIVPHLFVPLISLRPPFGGMSCGTIPGGRTTLPKWPKQLPNIAQNC